MSFPGTRSTLSSPEWTATYYRLGALAELTVRVHRPDGSELRFPAIARVDGSVEVEYLRHGGVLPMVYRQLLPGRRG